MGKKFDYATIEVIILGLIGLILSGAIFLDKEVLEMFPYFGPDTSRLTIQLTICIFVYAFMKTLDVKASKFRLPKFKTELNTFKKVEFLGKKREITIITATTYMMVPVVLLQVILQLLSQVKLFQTAKVAVFEFFILAAIAEEFLFRLVIAEGLYKLLSSAILNEKLRVIICALVSAISFAAIHTRYYSDITLLLTVALGGFVYSYFMLKFDMELPSFIAHIINNVIAAGSVVQYIN